MDNDILGCTVIIYPDCDESEEKRAERDRLGEAFRTLIWGADGEGGIAKELKAIPYEPYGNDLEFILLDFQVTPTDYVRDAIKDVGGYSKKEKSIDVNIIIEEDFFSMSQAEQFNHLKGAILSRLDMLRKVIARRKFDTDIDKLITTVDEALKGPLTSTVRKECPTKREVPPEPIEPIGALASKGKESQVDVEKLTALAEQGDAAAQYNLAYSYHSGEGVRKDEAKAVEWYTKAAEQGIVDAQYCLALHYFKGEGVPVDYGKAAEWCKKAAKQGDKQARSLLRHLQRRKQ